MVDTDVRLGLSGSDLAIRNRTFKSDLARIDESTLNADNSPEFKVLADAGLAGEIVFGKRFRDQDFLTVRKDRIVDILAVLHDDPNLDYRMVSDILGVGLTVNPALRLSTPCTHPLPIGVSWSRLRLMRTTRTLTPLSMFIPPQTGLSARFLTCSGSPSTGTRTSAVS
jgi:hypothetical protein